MKTVALVATTSMTSDVLVPPVSQAPPATLQSSSALLMHAATVEHVPRPKRVLYASALLATRESNALRTLTSVRLRFAKMEEPVSIPMAALLASALRV